MSSGDRFAKTVADAAEEIVATGDLLLAALAFVREYQGGRPWRAEIMPTFQTLLHAGGKLIELERDNSEQTTGPASLLAERERRLAADGPVAEFVPTLPEPGSITMTSDAPPGHPARDTAKQCEDYLNAALEAGIKAEAFALDYDAGLIDLAKNRESLDALLEAGRAMLKLGGSGRGRGGRHE